MNTSLPIFTKKDEIVAAVRDFDTVILAAETGSGKSTQVPQYLYEAGYQVVITQPRRIACLTLADRVSEEMGGEPSVCGYRTAFESTETPDTRILFCTDGLQVARGLHDKRNFVLVLDEVHEWNLNIETLVAWVKKFRADGNSMKVVLMSATLDTDALARFYAENSTVKVISVEGRAFPVSRRFEEGAYFESIVEDSLSRGHNVLAFLPGKAEIADAMESVSVDLKELGVSAVLLPIHGDLPAAEQRKVFQQYDVPKCVFATNIAQTSVTIPDIDVVVDLGTEKRVEYADGIEGLFERCISKADIEQRAGRAGRVKPGEYILCSSTPFDDRREFPVPEIQRLVLDKTVLKLASVGIDAEEISFFHQPEKDAIIESKKSLNRLGALDWNTITELGRRLARIPVSVQYGRMIVEADRFGQDAVHTILKLAAIMESGSLLDYRAVKNRTENLWGSVYEEKFCYDDFSSESRSDLFAELDIFEKCANHEFRNFRNSGVNGKAYFRAKELYEKLCRSLDLGGIVDIYGENKPHTKTDLFRCVAVGLLSSLCGSVWGDYKDENGIKFKLPKSSCIPAAYFLVGIPKQITFTGKYGITTSMNLMTMATSLTKEDLFAIIPPGKLEQTVIEGDVSFDAANQVFYIPYAVSYHGFDLGNKVKTVSSDSACYAAYLEKYKDVVSNGNSKIVFLAGRRYNVDFKEGFWNRPSKWVVYCDDDLKKNKEITSATTSDGHPITFNVGGFMGSESNNLQDLRNRVIISEKKNTEREYISSFPPATTSFKVFAKICSQVGVKEFCVSTYDEKWERFVGIALDSGKAEMRLFASEDEMLSATKEAVDVFLNREIKSKCPDKAFIVKIDGHRKETKKTQNAKEEFHSFAADIIKEANHETIVDSLDLIFEAYQDAIAPFQKSA